MKRKLSLFAVAVATMALAFALCGCSLLEAPESYTPEKKDPVVAAPAIGEDGVLRVGVNSSNAPFSAQVSGDIVGVDIDVAAALADQMGLTLRIVDVGTDPEGALSGGKVDVIMNVDTTETTTTCWTSDTYLESSVALFSMDPAAPLPNGNAAKPAETEQAAAEGTEEAAAEGEAPAEGEEDAEGEAAEGEASAEGESAEGEAPAEGEATQASKGDVIVAQTSSMSAWEVENQYGQDALKTEDDLKTCFNDLASGTYPYVAADAVIGSYVAHSSSIDAYIIGIMEAANGYCIGVGAENLELQQAVSNALGSLQSSGVVNVIEKKWLGSSIDISSYAMTDAAVAGAEAAAAEAAKAEADEGQEEQASGEEITAESEGEAGANAVEVTDEGGGEEYVEEEYVEEYVPEEYVEEYVPESTGEEVYY